MNFSSAILALLEIAFGFWNNQISLVFELLGQSPTEFKGGGPWGIIVSIEPIFVAVGASLVVLFFVMGFCAESLDIREEMRFEVILRILLRLAVAEWLVVNSLTIMEAFFTSIGNLVLMLDAGTTPTLEIGEEQRAVIEDLGFLASIPMLIITLIIALVVIVCGFFIIYEVYMRFLKILIIVPLGALALSTFGGNRGVSHTAATYFKYFLAVTLEAVAMALAVILCNAVINSGLPTFTGDYEPWCQVTIYLCELVFTIAMTVGSIKGAPTLVTKALGLA